MTDLETVFRDRVKEERGRRQLTTEELSAFLADRLGVKLHATAITKLEKGQRGVSLQEAVGLALALGVPLPLMLVPADSEDGYAITPGLDMYPGRALNWMLRGEPALDFNIKGQTRGMWKVVAIHRAGDENEAAREAGHLAWRLERSGDDATAARHRYHVALVKLRDALDSLNRQGMAGVAAGWWPDGIAEDLAAFEAEAEGADPQPVRAWSEVEDDA